MNYARKRTRPKMGLRTSDRVRSDGHLAWLRNTRECLAAVGRDPCGGKMHAHHVRHANNAGTALKPPDSDAVPLCDFHHRRLHDGGVDWFQKFYGVDLDKAKDDCWHESPHRRKHEAANTPRPTPTVEIED